jgi:hypothetical protein
VLSTRVWCLGERRGSAGADLGELMLRRHLSAVSDLNSLCTEDQSGTFLPHYLLDRAAQAAKRGAPFALVPGGCVTSASGTVATSWLFVRLDPPWAQARLCSSTYSGCLPGTLRRLLHLALRQVPAVPISRQGLGVSHDVFLLGCLIVQHFAKAGTEPGGIHQLGLAGNGQSSRTAICLGTPARTRLIATST